MGRGEDSGKAGGRTAAPSIIVAVIIHVDVTMIPSADWADNSTVGKVAAERRLGPRLDQAQVILNNVII